MEECRRIESRPRPVEEELGVRMRFVKTYCFVKGHANPVPRRCIFSRLVSRRCLISTSLLT
jgi:hypothetical protein